MAELGSNIVIDFTEPVSPVTSATINVRFATDGNNDRGGVDFVLNAEDGVGSLANTRYTYTLPENFKGSANYYLEFAVNTFQDASTNQILAYDDFDDQDYLFTTVSDGVAPFIESVTDTAGNSLAASGLVQLDEDSVILYITFSEPVTSTATDGQNGRISFFYEDENFRAHYVGDTVIYNTWSDRGATSAIKFVDNFTDRNYVTTPSRYVIIDLEESGDTLAADNGYSLHIDQNSFLDGSGNTFGGLDQANNDYTFTVTNDADITDIAPQIVRYFAADTTLAGLAELGSNIMIDFTEPVDTVPSGEINVHFITNSDTERGGIDFTLNAEDGVASLAKTRYTYTLPENFKGNATYYLEFAANTFEDASNNPIASYDDFNDKDFLFTTINDLVEPFIESITDTAFNELTSTATDVQLEEDSVILYITFSEPVTTSALANQNGRISFFYKDEGFRAHYVGDTVIYNTQNNRAADDAIKFVDNFTDRNYVTTPTRYVIIDLVENGDTLAADNEYSLHIDQNSFIDGSNNTHPGIDQANNDYVFTVVKDADITNIAPEVVRYFAADTSGTEALLGTDLVIDFTEPVGTSGINNIALKFAEDSVTQFRISSTEGDSTLGGTRYVFSLPENLKGSNEYYITIDDGAFFDESGFDLVDDSTGAIAYSGVGDGFTTISDNVAPIITYVFPADNSLTVDVTDSMILVFDEPIIPTVGSDDIYVLYSDSSEFTRINLYDDSHLGGGSIVTTDFTNYQDTVTIDLNALGILPGVGFIIVMQEDAVFDKSANGNGLFELGAYVADGSYTFSADDDGAIPSLTAIYPTDDVNDPTTTTAVVVEGDTLKLTFSEAVLPYDTDSTRRITVYNYATGTKAIEFVPTQGIASNGNTFFQFPFAETLDGSAALSGQNNYYVNVDAGSFYEENPNGGAEDLVAITGQDTWNWKTTNDTEIPTYTFAPVNGAINVDPEGTISLTFNEYMETEGTISIYYADDDQLVQTVSTGTLSNATDFEGSTFTYDIDIPGNSNFYARVDGAYQDSTGLAATAQSDGSSWTFTTTTETNNPDITITLVGGVADPVDSIEFTITQAGVEKIYPGTGEITINYNDGADEVQVWSFIAGAEEYALPMDTLRGGISYIMYVPEGAYEDASGNPSNAATFTFSTIDDDGRKPYVLAFIPPIGREGVDVNTNIEMEFDQPMQPQTGTKIELRYQSSDELVDSFDPNVDGVRSLSNTKYTFNPIALEGNTEYYINVLSNAFLDSIGTALDSIPSVDTTWVFTTGDGGTLPDATTLTPVDGVTTFDLRDTIEIVFDEPVFATNLDMTLSGGPLDDIVINAKDDEQILGDGSTTIRIAPFDTLYDGVDYVLTIPDGTFEDASGNDFNLQADTDVDAATADQYDIKTINAIFVDDGTSAGADWGQTVTPEMNTCIDGEYIVQQEPIYFIESNVNDFRNTTGTIIMQLSSGFAFNTAAIPNVTNDNAAGDFSDGNLVASFNSTNQLQITFSGGATAAIDSVMITGLEIETTDSTSIGAIIRTGGTMDAYGLMPAQRDTILKIILESVTSPEIVSGSPSAGGEIQLENITFCLSSDYTDVNQDNYNAVQYVLDNSYSDLSINVETGGADDFFVWYRDEAMSDPIDTADASDETVDFNDLFKPADYAAMTSAQSIDRWVTYVNPNLCESEPTRVTITIYGLPDAEVLAGEDYDIAEQGNVCSFDEITLGEATNNGLSSTPAAYTFNWYGTLLTRNYDGTQLGMGDSASVINDANPTFDAPDNDSVAIERAGLAAQYVGPETVQYGLYVTDNNGCQSIADGSVDVIIDRRVDARIESENGQTFALSTTVSQPIYGDLGAINYENTDGTLAAGYTGLFSGAGLGTQNLSGNDFHKVNFIPNAAGIDVLADNNQIHKIAYFLTEDATGCTDSTSTDIIILRDQSAPFELASGAAVPEQICFSDSIFVSNDLDFNVSANIASGDVVVRLVGPGVSGTDGSMTGWSFDIDSAWNTPALADTLTVLANGGKAVRIYRVVNDADGTGDDYTDGSYTIVVYPLPEVEITNVESYYCEDSNPFELTYNVTNNGITEEWKPDSIRIEVVGPTDVSHRPSNFGNVKYTSTIASLDRSGQFLNDSLEFAALLADSDIGLDQTLDIDNNKDEIKYKITIVSRATDDPLQETGGPNGCDVQADTTFTLFYKMPIPTLDLSSSDVGNDLGDDEYLFEYCEFVSIENLIVHPYPTGTIDIPTTINWYEDDGTGNGLGEALSVPVSDQRDIASFTIFGTTTPSPGEYIYHFSQTSNYIDGVFDGCESEFATVRFVIHDVPDEPELDLTASNYGELISTNHYAFEYCEGVNVEGMSVLVGADMTEEFTTSPTGWSFNNTTVASDELTITDGSGNYANSAVIEGYNGITIRYKSATDGQSANASVYFSNNNGTTYEEFVGRLNTSSSTASDTTFVLPIFGSSTSKIQIISDGTGAVDLAIESIAFTAVVDDISFYDWYDINNNVLDGFFSNSNVTDGSAEGTYSSQGNVSNTATELFATLTPSDSTYTYYLSRREDRNINEGGVVLTNKFDGCVSAKTQIDIHVYPIPAAPSAGLFDTDVNISAGATKDGTVISYNDRIALDDYISTPGVDSIEYRWYEAAAGGTTFDSVRSDYGDGKGYAEVVEIRADSVPDLTSLTSVLDGSSSYFTSAAEFNKSIFLSQTTYKLNRVTTIATDFVGCESTDRTEVAITMYPVEYRPVVNNFDDDSDSNGDDVEFDFCTTDLTSATSFDATTLFSSGTNSQKFTWYFSDASRTRSTDNIVSTADASGANITAAEMLVAGITSDQTRYFLVTQTTDIESGDTFDGSESDGTLVKINIWDIPDAPSEETSANANDPGLTSFYYCDDETISSLTVISYDDDAGDNLFYWYAAEADALAQDSTKRLATGAVISTAEMVPDETNNAGDVLANLANDPGPGTYTFYVTQASNKQISPTSGFSGDRFYGCESEPLEITIYVRDIPVTPSVFDQTQFICVGDATPTFTINGYDTKITYVWYDSASTERARGQSYTPGSDFETVNIYDFSVTQITDINIANSGFVGCESPVTDLVLTIREIPEKPPLTGTYEETTDAFIYEICEGDSIPTFFINDPDTDTTTVYNWYDRDNNSLEDILGTGISFNPEGDLTSVLYKTDFNNLKPEQPNDFLFRVKITTNINDPESFDGCTSSFQNVILRINGLPSLSFSDIASNNEYCLEENAVTFSAAPLGIDGTGRFSIFSDFGQVGTGLTDNGDETATLDLDVLHLSDSLAKTIGGEPTARNIYFEYTDVKGCVNTDSVINIVVNPYPWIDFRIDDTVVDTFYTCLNEELQVFKDRQFKMVGFTVFDGASIGQKGQSSDFRLYDEDRNELQVGILSDLDAVAEFSPKIARRNLSETSDNIQDFAPANDYTVTFTHTDEFGCTSTVENVINVRPKPQLETKGVIADEGFVITNKACAADTIDFDVNLVNMPNSDATFSWTISTEALGQKSVEDQFGNKITVLDTDFGLGGGLATINVIVENNFTGCKWEAEETKEIGVIPVPQFRWENVSVDETTRFIFDEVGLTSFSSLANMRFTIQDADGNEFSTENRSESHLSDFEISFDDPGVYSANFYLQSNVSCDSSITRSFNILDYIPVDPQVGIIHDFNENGEGWFTDSVSTDGFYDGIGYLDEDLQSRGVLRYSTWEQGLTVGATINGESAWVTNLDGAYASKGEDNTYAEHSFVYSPSYDLSQLDKPSLSFNYNSDLVLSDGVVLQYSIDDGATWGTIGEYNFFDGNSGINWYTFEGVPGNPGNYDANDKISYNPTQNGWNTDTRGDWLYASHKIDFKDNNGQYVIPKEEWNDVRFRFALGSRPAEKIDENGNSLEGFAFDNFRIYDRQKVVLFESFSSILSGNSLKADSITQDRFLKLGEGAVWINYFTDLDGELFRDDPIFERNEVDPSARGSFYGISAVPTSVLDGKVIEKIGDAERTADRVLGWNQFELNKAELIEPGFDILLGGEMAQETDKLEITGTFTSLVDLPENTELAFRFFVVEKYITGIEVGNYKASDTIFNVMRKMLLDEDEYVKKGAVIQGDRFEQTVEWTLDAVLNLESLRIVAIVQNEVTREIYQVAFADISGKENTVTSIDYLSKNETFDLYPNPTDKHFRVKFEKPIGNEVSWKLIDQSGKQMKSGIINRKTLEYEIPTEQLPNGVYILQMSSEIFDWEPTRVIIIHR
ncbi:MAG: Ig-like domain-containing protein [Cyclobacteriaceae bacterium]